MKVQFFVDGVGYPATFVEMHRKFVVCLPVEKFGVDIAAQAVTYDFKKVAEFMDWPMRET